MVFTMVGVATIAFLIFSNLSPTNSDSFVKDNQTIYPGKNIGSDKALLNHAHGHEVKKSDGDGYKNNNAIADIRAEYLLVKSLERVGTADKSKNLRDKSKQADAVPSTPQPEELQSETSRYTKQVRPYLNDLHKLITEMEMGRCAFDVHDFSNYEIAKVTIARPSASEVFQLQEFVKKILPSLPSDLQPYFLVDGKRMIDRYTHFTHDYIVLFVSMNSVEASVSKIGRYWEFYTNTPSNFIVNNEHNVKGGGRIIVPEGVPKVLDKPWIGSNFRPPERYSHLFQKR